MLVDIDDREPKEALLMMEKVGMLPDRKRLKVGDYVYEEVGIERKTIDDFCMSIIDGRIKRQGEALKTHYKHCFILINGHIKDRTSDIHEHVLLAMMASLATRLGITILTFDNEYQLFYCMKKIFEKYIDEMKKKHAVRDLDKQLAIDKMMRKKEAKLTGEGK